MRSRSTLEDDLATLHRLERICAGKGTLREAREAVGLSIGQAVRVTGIERARFEALEGGAEATAAEHAVLCKTYDVPGWVS